MTFLLPLGLLALLTLPIIALLHLIQQRRERRRVPSLQIWRDLQRQTVQHKPRRLPLTLLLLLHLLLAMLLAVALGQPLLEAARGEATHTVIVLDTSTSMAATDESPSRLEAAKAEARRLIASPGRGDSAAVIELSAQPRIVGQSTGNDTSTLLRQLDRMRAGGPDGDLARALNLAQATAQPEAALQIVILTDRALRAAETPTVAGEVRWQIVGADGDNVAIVAFAGRPLRSGQQQLYARVANLGTVPIARTLYLNLDGSRAATEPMRLQPGAEAEWSWPLPAGTTRAEASLSGEDLQPLDDRAAVVVGGNARSDVVLVTTASETTALERALRAQRGLDVRRVSPADYRASADAALVVFDNYLPTTFPAAPVLIVTPPRGQTVVPVTKELGDLTATVINDQRFAAIDFRPVRFQRVVQVETPAWANVAVANGSTPLVLTGQYNNHPIAIWTFDPSASNITNRLAFPLLTAATTRALLPQANDRLLVGTAAPFALRSEDGVSVAAGERLTQPGIYQAQNGTGAVAVNALDADEADLRSRPEPTVNTVSRPVATDDQAELVGRELWKPLVIAGLVVLLFEWLYSNRDSLRRGRALRGKRADT
ncbi:MAG TPA: VWA domain-containing protein [Herpetosiphonaceae bacterium]